MDLRGEGGLKKLWHRSQHVLWKWNSEFNSGEARSVHAPVYPLIQAKTGMLCCKNRGFEFRISYPKRDNELNRARLQTSTTQGCSEEIKHRKDSIYQYLLYRDECFIGKYTPRKIYKNYIRDQGGLFSIISHVDDVILVISLYYFIDVFQSI